MRLTPTLIALCLLLGGCALPGRTTVGQTDREGTIGAGSGLFDRSRLPGGANVIAAGGANVIAAGGANVVAAGGGNISSRSNEAAAKAPASGGGSLAGLIASASSQVIAAGGMNIAPPVGGQLSSSDTPAAPGGLNNDSPIVSLPGELEEPAPAPTPGTLTGKVLAPGALASAPSVLLPLAKAWVRVYDLAGNPLGAAVETSASGAFSIADVPGEQIVAVRTAFTYAGVTYYLSSLVRVEGGAATTALTPLTTLAEAQFFKRCPPTLPSDDLLPEAYLDAFRAASEAHAIHVPATALRAGASIDARSAAYTTLKTRFSASFTRDIDAVFDQANDNLTVGGTGGGGTSGYAAL